MKHLNDDMDELFQRAGSNYPLRNNDSAWDAVAQRIQEHTAPKAKNKGRKRYAGLVLLFLSAGILSSLLTQLTINTNKTTVQNTNIDESKSQQPVVMTNTTQVRAQAFHQPNIVALFNNELNVSLAKNKKIPLPTEKLLYIQPNNTSIDINNIVRTRNLDNNPLLTAINTEIDPKENLSDSYKDEQDNKRAELLSNGLKRPRFYGGFVIGPQLNQVKSQGMGRLSVNIGVLGGYRFARHFSVEAGLLYSQKHYFSDGKYFQMKNSDAAMPPDMKVMSLQSCTNIFEVPVKLRYDLPVKKAAIFSTAGISSYILTKEKNDYVTMLNGNRNEMTGNYKNTSRYLAAALNLSVGYEHRIGKRNSLRLEPYIQVPVKGIGVGSMPVTSAGLHIGITWNHK